MQLNVHGPVGRTIQRAMAHASVGPVVLRVMPRVDRFVSRTTRGHFLLSQLLVPMLVLTTTGARTGLPRSTPLATLPDRTGTWYVVGSNLGGEAHPAWSANLIKTPRAVVTFRGETTEVDAQLLDEAERAELWPQLRAVWPSYDRYAAISGRELRVFRLTRRPQL